MNTYIIFIILSLPPNGIAHYEIPTYYNHSYECAFAARDLKASFLQIEGVEDVLTYCAHRRKV